MTAENKVLEKEVVEEVKEEKTTQKKSSRKKPAKKKQETIRTLRTVFVYDNPSCEGGVICELNKGAIFDISDKDKDTGNYVINVSANISGYVNSAFVEEIK